MQTSKNKLMKKQIKRKRMEAKFHLAVDSFQPVDEIVTLETKTVQKERL